MATAPGVNDAPSESTMTQASNPPPTEGQTYAMEVDDEGIHSCPASPVSTVEDDLLTGSGAVGVESDLAHLMVSSPRSLNGEGEEAFARRHSPCLLQVIGRHPLWPPPGLVQRRNEAIVLDEEGRVEPTPERPFFEAYCINLFHNVFKL